METEPKSILESIVGTEHDKAIAHWERLKSWAWFVLFVTALGNTVAFLWLDRPVQALVGGLVLFLCGLISLTRFQEVKK